MEKLSHKRLPDVKGIRIGEDIRFDIPQGRLKFLGRALYDNIFVFPKANFLYAAIIVTAAIFDILNSEFIIFPLACLIILILKGSLAFLITDNTAHSRNPEYFRSSAKMESHR